MTKAGEIRTMLGELAALTESTEEAERRILTAAEQRLATLQADQDDSVAASERATLLVVIKRARKALRIA